MASNAFGSRKRPTHRRSVSVDGVDAVDMVNREKLSRQLAMRLPPIGRSSDTPLFEHFLVFGQSHLKSDPVKAICLFKYPSDKTVTLQALEQLVFPSGIPADKDTSRIASSVVEYQTKNPQNQFVLLLTTSLKEVFYAICVMDEYLKEYPSFIPPTTDPTYAKLVWNTRCYCIVTRYPFFDFMFELLIHMLDVEEKSLTLPVAHRIGELNQINRILEYLWTLTPPKPSLSLKVGIPKINELIRPLKFEDETCIAQHCVPTLLWLLDKDTILGLVSAALLERKLLFVSSNLRILSNSILSFVALLKPFVLQCVFIPVLPDEHLHIVEAPVPFIAGLPNPKLLRNARDANAELIVVDLDTKRVSCPDDVDVPPLPNIKSIGHAIDSYLVQLRKTFDKYTPPYNATRAQKTLVTELLRLLEQYITPYFEAFRRHCITSLTDNVTVFVKETYLLEETDPQSINFFQSFMETQVFQHWCETKLAEIDRQRMSKLPAPASSIPKPQQSSSTPATSVATSVPTSLHPLPKQNSPPISRVTSAGNVRSQSASYTNLSKMLSQQELEEATGDRKQLQQSGNFIPVSISQSKGMGSPTATRSRSLSMSSSINEDLVAGLQFDVSMMTTPTISISKRCDSQSADSDESEETNTNSFHRSQSHDGIVYLAHDEDSVFEAFNRLSANTQAHQLAPIFSGNTISTVGQSTLSKSSSSLSDSDHDVKRTSISLNPIQEE